MMQYNSSPVSALWEGAAEISFAGVDRWPNNWAREFSTHPCQRILERSTPGQKKAAGPDNESRRTLRGSVLDESLLKANFEWSNLASEFRYYGITFRVSRSLLQPLGDLLK